MIYFQNKTKIRFKHFKISVFFSKLLGDFVVEKKNFRVNVLRYCYYMRSEAIKSNYFRTVLSAIYNIPHTGCLQVFLYSCLHSDS